MKNNTNFGENTLYVQRIFSIQQRQYADNQTNAGGGKTFWQKHKGKILAGAALAAAGGLGALGYANKDKIANSFTSAPESQPKPAPIRPNAKHSLTAANQWIAHLNFAKDDWVMDLEIIARNLEIAANDEYTHADALVLRGRALTIIDPHLSEIERRRATVSDPEELKKVDMTLSMAKGLRNRIASIR